NWTSIKSIHLSSNNLSSLPLWFGGLNNQVYLDLSRNALSFNDFDFSGCIKHDIEELYLSINKLNGNLPTWIGHLQKLGNLDLSSNYFCSSILQSLGMTKDCAHALNSTNQDIVDERPFYAEIDWQNQDVKQVMKGKEYDIARILRLEVNFDL
ncbi:receptor protein kinase-like protein ZAR1, partial [Neltuma alba]|uniref:receptor protein kinase-like protein ZAR1 n=1 Tax=Neltuma alba TaxID=207710 RepID=UPI0010A4588C